MTRLDVYKRQGEDFAYLPMIERDEPLTISQYTLKNMIYQTIFSIAVNDNNKLMTGELFEIKDNCLKIVSLDGHRIAIRKMPLKKDYSEDVYKRQMEPIAESIFSSMLPSVMWIMIGFLSPSLTRSVARSIQSRNSFLLMESLVS